MEESKKVGKVERLAEYLIAVAIAIYGLTIGVYTILVEPNNSGLISGIVSAVVGLIGCASVMLFRRHLFICIILVLIAYGLAFWWGLNAPSWIIRLLCR